MGAIFNQHSCISQQHIILSNLIHCILYISIFCSFYPYFVTLIYSSNVFMPQYKFVLQSKNIFLNFWLITIRKKHLIVMAGQDKWILPCSNAVLAALGIYLHNECKNPKSLSFFSPFSKNIYEHKVVIVSESWHTHDICCNVSRWRDGTY